ncbi:MAG: sugar O-acetyltransferase [Cyanobacteria bacterium SIG27]|nr:sugar O-acetyltransferase [Cyanobacteria bacterium SIG27]
MSEKEKMLAGVLYDSTVDELSNERLKAKNLCYEYNLLRPDEFDKKKELLKNLLGKVGKNYIIEPNFFCDYGYNIEISENFYSNHNLVILDCAKVTFGDNVFIGPNCSFYTAQHPIDPIERNKLLEYAKPITIGSNVWIGGSVTILSGVTIGDNCTIGAGSVVVKDIPANSVALGNPCKVIKKI